MKTATITLHDTDNCGSSLQAFALNYFLNDNGIQNEIIDYVPKYTQDGGHSVKAFIRNILFCTQRKRSLEKFDDFKNKYLIRTAQRYTTLSQLQNNPPNADIYITGSDQLWNDFYACGRDEAFYLNFGDKRIRKIAYAMSTGKSTLSPNMREMISTFCNDFEWLSFRENEPIDEVRKILPGKKVDLVSDPVLLIAPKVYHEMKADRIIGEKYILVYIAQAINEDNLNEFVNNIKEIIGIECKVVFIGSYRKRCRSDYHIRSFNPQDFLSLIYYSEYVVSNSFHASIFSTLFKKQFMTFVPEGNGSRLRNLFNIAGVDNGIYNCNINNEVILRGEDELSLMSNRISEYGIKSGELLLSVLGKESRYFPNDTRTD